MIGSKKSCERIHGNKAAHHCQNAAGPDLEMVLPEGENSLGASRQSHGRSQKAALQMTGGES